MLKNSLYFYFLCTAAFAISLCTGCYNGNQRNGDDVNSTLLLERTDTLIDGTDSLDSDKQQSVSSVEYETIYIEEDIPGIEYENELLRVSVDNEKFRDVMNTVAHKTGIKVVLLDTQNDDITVSFDFIPLEKGLQKLLNTKNYLLIHESDNPSHATRIAKVIVFPKGKDTVVFKEEDFRNPFESGSDIFDELEWETSWNQGQISAKGNFIDPPASSLDMIENLDFRPKWEEIYTFGEDNYGNPFAPGSDIFE